MKRLLIFLMVIAGCFGAALAQGSAPTVNAPSAPDNANPRDNNIKLRSVELERVKRDSERKEIKPGVAVKSELDLMFPQIKEDFEGIQISESAIIKTYTMDRTADLMLISTSAGAIYRHALRLEENLFLKVVAKRKKSEKKDKAVEMPPNEPELPAGMKELIVSLDNAIGRLVTNKMFSNLRVVDPADAANAHDDVILIKRLSTRLSEVARSGKQ